MFSHVMYLLSYSAYSIPRFMPGLRINWQGARRIDMRPAFLNGFHGYASQIISQL